MNIDTLLGLLSQSFHFFKKSVTNIVPFIILYTIIYNILVVLIYPNQNFQDMDALISFSESLTDKFHILLFIIFIQTIYYVSLLNYIFIKLKNNSKDKLNLEEESSSSIFDITKILQLSGAVIGLSVLILIPVILLVLFESAIFILFAFILFIILYYFLFLFVIYIMIDKGYSFINSIVNSCVLAINNIGHILLFSSFNILANIVLMFIAFIGSSFISAINSEIGLLFNQILINIGSYLLLIWFINFYLYLSKKN